MLGFVGLIWGIIGYKILSAVNPNASPIEAQEFSVNFNPEKQLELDTFSVQTVNRDPFLGTLLSNKKKIKKKKRESSKPDLVWPSIIYQGLVKDKNSNVEQIFIISVNGKQGLLKRNKVFNEVTIIKGNKKELVVKYKGKLKTIELKR